MNFPAHAAFGFIEGAAAASRWTPRSRRRLYILTVGSAMFPDIDGVLYLKDFAEFVVNHRGVTHSAFGLMVFPWLLAAIARPYAGRRGYLRAVVLSAIAYATGILGDLIDPWGVLLAAPFAPTRVALGVTPFNPVILQYLVFAGAAAAVLLRTRRMTVAMVITGVVTAYLGVCGFTRTRAATQFCDTAEVLHAMMFSCIVYPTEWPHVWEGVALTRGGWAVATVDVRAGERTPFQYAPAHERTALRARAEALPEVRIYRWLFPHVVVRETHDAQGATVSFQSDRTALLLHATERTWDYGGVTVRFDATGRLIKRKFLGEPVTDGSAQGLAPWVLGGRTLLDTPVDTPDAY